MSTPQGGATTGNGGPVRSSPLARRLASERGLSVPEDLSLVGFDDIPPAVRNVPPLTTVRQPLTEKGVVAYQLLQELLADQPARSVVLPVELIVRESTAPPR